VLKTAYGLEIILVNHLKTFLQGSRYLIYKNFKKVFLIIHHFDKEKKMKRDLVQRVTEYRENLKKSKNSEVSKDGEREIIMFAKKLLEKEGFIVKRLREETDFEDEDGE
jgi:phosphopantetheine adenylyltransferase